MKLNTLGSVARCVVVGCGALALFAASAAAQSTQSSDAVSEARRLFTDGQLVAAKQTLLDVLPADVSEADRAAVAELLRDVNRALQAADPLEISLQKAAWALAHDDLRTTDRHAAAVLRAERATAGQRERASGLLDAAAKARAAFQPLVDDALSRAEAALGEGDAAGAKSEAEAVIRSGVRLSDAQRRTLDRIRERVLDAERRAGAPLPEPVAAPAAMADHAADAEEAAAEQGGQEAQPGQPDAEDLFQAAKRFDAQRLLREADAAFEGGRLNEALQKYSALSNEYNDVLSQEQRQHVERRIGETRTLLDQPDLVEQMVEQRQIVREETVAEFNNFLARAGEALSQGDTDQARQLVSEAQVRLTQARDVFSDQEFTNLISRVDQTLVRIRDEEERIRQREAEDRAEQLRQQQRAREAEQLAERNRKVADNLDRIRELQREQRYEEALQLVETVLFLDPQNPAGLLLKDVLQDVIIYREWERTQRDKNLSLARESLELQKSLVAPPDIMNYPPDWPEISVRRGEPQAFAESPADRRVLAELDSRRIPASFTDNSLEDVVEFVATVTNLNVDVDWDALANIGVDRDTPITLNLQPMPARVVLERVLEKASPDAFSRAAWAVNDGVLVIASEEALRRNTFIAIYDVRDLTFTVRNATEAPQIDLNNVLNRAAGGGGGGSAGGSGAIFEGDDIIETAEPSRDDLLAQIEDIIRQSVDFEGWRENGGDTGSIQEYNGNFIITNTARNHRQISALLRQLREIRSIQINVQANFLAVDQNFFEQIGFDVDLLFNAEESQFEDALAQQSLFALQTPSGRSNLRPSDLIQPFFAGDGTGSILEFQIDPDDLPQPGQPAQDITVGNFPTPFSVTRPDNISIIPTQQNSLGLAETLFGGTGFAQSILSSNPALGVAGTFLDEVQVDFLIEATQADGRSVSLTAPRLTITNGRRANVFFTTQQAFVSNLTPVVGTSSVAFNPQLSSLNTGVTLDLEGVVSADRRYVTMNIQTGIAELVSIERQSFSATAGGVGAGGAGTGAAGIAEGFIDFPNISVTSITTGVTVPDQGTLLLGGQRITSENEVETGVPVLSKIPLLNRFFTNRIEETSERTLMILLKPTILIQSEEEEKNFPGLLDTLRNRFGSGF